MWCRGGDNQLEPLRIAFHDPIHILAVDRKAANATRHGDMEHHYGDSDFELWLSSLLACLEDMGATAYDASIAKQMYEDGLPPHDAAVELMA